jgi:hypothetical protein
MMLCGTLRKIAVIAPSSAGNGRLLLDVRGPA